MLCYVICYGICALRILLWDIHLKSGRNGGLTNNWDGIFEDIMGQTWDGMTGDNPTGEPPKIHVHLYYTVIYYVNDCKWAWNT